MKLLILSLIFCIHSPLINGAEKTCPDRCTCANGVMDCRSMQKSELPKIKDLKLEDTSAIFMDDNNLLNLTQIPEIKGLNRLSFANNKIADLSYDTFDNLDEVTYLKLTNNKLRTIADDIFEWNPLKLQILYLDHNEIEFIQHFLFYDLEELTEVYLDHNQITFIHPHAFVQLKNLRRLRLDSNKLHTFNKKWIAHFDSHAFSTLRFDDNQFSCDCDIADAAKWLAGKDSKWFNDINKEYPLTCSYPPTELDKNLADVDTTATLICQKPKIVQISQNTTIKQNQDILLQCVLEHPSRYPIPMISWEAPNKDVYKLQNADNFEGIEVRQDGSLKITNVNDDDAGKYTCIASNSQGSHSASMTLKVEGSVIDGDLIPDVTVDPRTVDQNHNSVVHSKECPAGCQCVSLNIDCSGDGSTKVDDLPDGIPHESLSINMAINNIKNLPYHRFIEFTELQELRLDNNEINNIDVNAFVGLDKLTTLTLRDNQLTTIEKDTFKPLKKLNVLVLDNNLLTKLNADMFKGLDSLSWLYVRNNEIAKIFSGVFSGTVFPELKFMHLENNKLTTIDHNLINDIVAFKQDKNAKIQKIFVDDNDFICDSKMEETRKAIQSSANGGHLDEMFADGIRCISPVTYNDMYLADITVELTGTVEYNQLGDDNKDVPINEVPQPQSNATGILIGGICLGIIVTIFGAIAWRKWGKRAKTLGRSYNYSNIGGDTDGQEAQGLTEPTYSGKDTEAFV